MHHGQLVIEHNACLSKTSCCSIQIVKKNFFQKTNQTDESIGPFKQK